MRLWEWSWVVLSEQRAGGRGGGCWGFSDPFILVTGRGQSLSCRFLESFLSKCTTERRHICTKAVLQLLWISKRRYFATFTFLCNYFGMAIYEDSFSLCYLITLKDEAPPKVISSLSGCCLRCLSHPYFQWMPRVGQSCRVLDPCKYLQWEFRCVDSAAADTASLTCEKEGSYVLRLNKHWTYYFILQHKEVLIFYRNAP